MEKKDKIIIIVIAIVVIIPIIINEIRLRPKIKLINDVNLILKNIDKYSNEDNYSKEYMINDGYTINDDNFSVKGVGVIFIDKSNSVFLSRNGMCAMKLPYNDKVMIQNEECPIYRMFNGIKVPVVNSGDGLYSSNDGYIFKGNSRNYVLYKKELWNIIVFSDNNVELIMNKPVDINYKNINDLYNLLMKKYSNIISDNNIIENEWSIEDYNSSKRIFEASKFKSRIGVLSPTEYLSSLINDYDYEENLIKLNDRSFLSKNMMLSSNSMYINNDNNIDLKNQKDKMPIYPVIKTKAIFEYGTGTLEDPYRIEETN